ncbi:MAG: hypothetical protein ACTSVI_16655 [Promethearchaeota archaeon]
MYDILGTLLIIIAIIFIVLLSFHVQSEKPLSLKFTFIAIAIISLAVGYGIHFILLSLGK